MVWGWLIASVMIQFVAFSMAELCSSMPTAVFSRLRSYLIFRADCIMLLRFLLHKAGVRWLRYDLPNALPNIKWITGWSNFLGQVTGPASVDYCKTPRRCF
jgi:amino acid transporter